MKDQFKPEWHWLREQHASHSGFAWTQDFDGGYQLNASKLFNYRARAVRRLPI